MEDNEAAVTKARTEPMKRSDTASKLSSLENELDTLDESEITSMSDAELARLRDTIKAVEDTSESVRKELVDDELKSRVAPGESLHGISHIESHRKYLAEDDMSVVMRAVAKGINFHDFVDVNASTLANEYPELAEIGEHEYSYLR
jgi:hypothetical protein